MVGFPTLEALVFVLIFNTAPVAFGALGVPVTVLGAVTGLPSPVLGAMIGRQLPIIALFLPFYVMAIYGGMRSVRAIWPALLIAGGSFAIFQFVSSNYINYALTDVLASLGSLIVTLLFLQAWKPAPDPEFAVNVVREDGAARSEVGAWQGWLPWLIVTVVVILWTTFGIAAIGQQSIPWPGLNKMISITLYNDKPYAAVWAFQPLATGTAILLSAIITAVAVGMRPSGFFTCVGHTIRQAWLAVITVCLIVGLAYLMNYSGMAYTLGLGASSMGHAFVFISPFLGWLAVFLSGSDTSGNALFGNLQVVAAKQLGLDPGPVRCDQLVRRRDGQDDLAAEHRDRRRGDKSERTGGRRLRPDLLAQRHPDARARRPGRPAAICFPGRHSALSGAASAGRQRRKLPSQTKRARRGPFDRSANRCRRRSAPPASETRGSGTGSHFRGQIGCYFHARADFPNFGGCPCHGRNPRLVGSMRSATVRRFLLETPEKCSIAPSPVK